MKHIRLFFLGALAICCSCSTENSFEPEEVKLIVSIEGTKESRVNLDGDKFVDGDEFTFFFEKDKPISNPAPLYQYDGSIWSTANPTYWDDQEEKTRQFCAVSPFDENDYVVISGNVHTFTVQADQNAEVNQNKEINYKKSDLLIARVNTSKRLIPIKFHHVFSRVAVNIKATTDPDNINGYFDKDDFKGMTVTLNDVKLTGNINYTNLPTKDDATYNPNVEVTATGTTESVNMHFKDAKPTVNDISKTVSSTFYAIVPPQPISEQPLLTIRIKVGETDKTYYYKVKSDVTVKNFVQGKQTTINLTLDKSKVELSDIDKTIQIVGWNEDISVNDNNPIELE